MQEIRNFERGLESQFDAVISSTRDEATLLTIENCVEDINFSDKDCATCLESTDVTITISKKLFERLQIERDNARKALTHAQMSLAITNGKCGRLQTERDKARTDLEVAISTREGENGSVYINIVRSLQKERDKAVNVLTRVKSDLSASKKECRQLWVEKDMVESALYDEKVAIEQFQRERDVAKSDLAGAQNTISTIKERNEQIITDYGQTKKYLATALERGEKLKVERDVARNELARLRSELSESKKECRRLWVEKDEAAVDHNLSLRETLRKCETLKIERDERGDALKQFKSELSASKMECRQLWVEKDKAQSELEEKYDRQIQDLVQDKKRELQILKTTNEIACQNLLTQRDEARNELAQAKEDLSTLQEICRKQEVQIRKAERAVEVVDKQLEERLISHDEVNQLRTERDQANYAIVKIQDELQHVQDTGKEIVRVSDEKLKRMKIDLVDAKKAFSEAEIKIAHWKRICQQVQIQRDDAQRELDELYEYNRYHRRYGRKLTEILTQNDDVILDQERSYWIVVETEASDKMDIGTDKDEAVDAVSNDDLSENGDADADDDSSADTDDYHAYAEAFYGDYDDYPGKYDECGNEYADEPGDVPDLSRSNPMVHPMDNFDDGYISLDDIEEDIFGLREIDESTSRESNADC